MRLYFRTVYMCSELPHPALLAGKCDILYCKLIWNLANTIVNCFSHSLLVSACSLTSIYSLHLTVASLPVQPRYFHNCLAYGLTPLFSFRTIMYDMVVMKLTRRTVNTSPLNIKICYWLKWLFQESGCN